MTRRDVVSLLITWVLIIAIFQVLNTFAGALTWPAGDLVLAALGIGGIVGWGQVTAEKLIAALRDRKHR